MTEQSSPKRANLLLPAVFGLIFGFLLQRGGMGKYEVLMGQLLLTDWAVLKVMVTAILVGMVGVQSMHSRGLVKLHLKPTRLVSNIGGRIALRRGVCLTRLLPWLGRRGPGRGSLGCAVWHGRAGRGLVPLCRGFRHDRAVHHQMGRVRQDYPASAIRPTGRSVRAGLLLAAGNRPAPGGNHGPLAPLLQAT